MQLLNVIRARSIWLADTFDLNPRGKYIGPSIIELLKDNYHFLKYPASPNDLDQNNALVFSQGSFQIKKDLVIAVDLSIYQDGVVADTRSSTKETDTFIENTLSLAVKAFGLEYRSEMIRQKLYVSELTVRPKNPLSGLNSGLLAFANKITSLLGEQGTTIYEPASISFWPDPSVTTQQVNFQFERKTNIPFSENRYYSRAPLHTDDHLKLLEEFEDLLVS